MHVKIFILGVFSLLAFSCVQSKVYKAELSSRQQCEARESVLVKEVMARREENAGLVKQIGDLNRQIGQQDAHIEELQSELTNRTIQMGESSSKLAQEKTAVESELADKTRQLTQSNAVLQSIKGAQTKRQEALSNLQKALVEKFPVASGATVIIDKDRVLLTLPDARLFEPAGLAISASGKALLKSLSEVLINQPELQVFVEAHTDNALPKDKSIKDTWDWSLVRATNVVRLLIGEYNVNANQLTPVGRGEFYPVASNENPDGRQKNRRTVVAMYPKLPAIPAVE